MAGKILIIEDDQDTSSLVKAYLQKDGFKVLSSADGFEGLRVSKSAQPDLIVLDLMLPGLDGIEICRTIRQDSSVPIIILTARSDEDTRLKGLELGADDYIVKPFSPRELVARVHAVLRRVNSSKYRQKSMHLVFENIVLDLESSRVKVNDTDIHATPTELRILELMMSNPDSTFSREKIISEVFNDGFEGFDRTVDTHMANLRKKISTADKGNNYFHTIYGSGYRFGTK